ncbi:hypothetical protein N0V84_004308 [Fusarium piperis]|uniref:Uncharacterized protein n=1 Tax=Fusarium piperis TaxID=1435070 RepID=A0A9W8WFW7_9HYPO|nr:hypothetical protein N0V84_004308 [Fusarium piperis]
MISQKGFTVYEHEVWPLPPICRGLFDAHQQALKRGNAVFQAANVLSRSWFSFAIIVTIFAYLVCLQTFIARFCARATKLEAHQSL